VSKIDDGGPIASNMVTQKFVDANIAVQDTVKAQGGLSLRDYFAATALQGLIQASALPIFDDNGKNTGMPTDSAHEAIINGPGDSDPNSNSPSSSLAWVAYGYADAMLAARKEGA
jgi:hypothetical protein